MIRNKRLMALFFTAFSIMATAGLSLAALAPAASAAPRPATAAAAPATVKNVTLCLTNSSSYCADVKNDSNTSGETVWLYSKSQAKDYHWIEYPETCPGGTPGGTGCFGFEDAADYHLCMAMNGSKNVVLMSCSASESEWTIVSPNQIRNATWGPAGLLTVTGASSKKPLIGAYPGTGWQKWSGQ